MFPINTLVPCNCIAILIVTDIQADQDKSPARLLLVAPLVLAYLIVDEVYAVATRESVRIALNSLP